MEAASSSVDHPAARAAPGGAVAKAGARLYADWVCGPMSGRDHALREQPWRFTGG